MQKTYAIGAVLYHGTRMIVLIARRVSMSANRLPDKILHSER